MLSSWRSYVVLLIIGLLVAVGVLIGTAPGDPSSTASDGVGAATPASVSGALSVPGVESLDGGEQERDQLLADRANPAMVEARLASRTSYERLDAAAAVRVIEQTMPSVTRKSPSGIGTLPAGVHVSRYLGSTAARLDLPGGKHALVESMTPMATATGSGAYAPVNLSLRESGQAFVAEDPAASVSIPKSLQSGVKLDSSGVSLSPVNASGDPLAGDGQLDGGAVVYPDTATDADTVAKPTANGFEVYDTLRSVASPQLLSYRVGMPAGASLRRDSSSSAAASVVAYGRTLASIPAASAIDADGAEVPVSTSVSGDTLRVKVDHRAGDFHYPIVVDPTVVDADLAWNANWRFVKGGGEKEGEEVTGYDWMLDAKAWVKQSEWGAFVYPTQGESHIYKLYMETSASTGNAVENHLAIANGAWEASVAMPKSYGRSSEAVCLVSCSSSGGSAGNVAMYWLNAIENAGGRVENGGTVTVYAGTVYVAQSNGPAVAVDSSEHDAKGRHNVFSGSGGWLSEHDANVAMFDESDPGVGVSSVEYTIAGKKRTETMESECDSVQCPSEATTSASLTYASGVPDGEQTIEFKAFDAMGSSAVTTAKVKVDLTAPHEITLSGLPGSDEINDSTRGLKLVAHATDGSGATPSSGVASIALAVDGQELGSPSGGCSPGPCTATGEWVVNGEEFAAGKHTFTVTATDAAGNQASSETTVTVHHAATIPVGPGQLNPVTGDFQLEETDASIATTGSPLTLTRSYSSREPGAGAGGAFGAPWSTSFGGAQELIRGRDHEVTLVSASGAQTEFELVGGGRFESPPGDSNLVLKSNEAETEYTLTDKGASTVFTHVSGDNSTVWRAAFSSGVGGANTTQYTYQVVGGVLEPLQELGPVPAGVSCAPSLKPGCRALTFNFATSTTATGEGSSEWGDYSGRLTRVYFATAEVKEGKVVQVTKTIAQYAYDSKGRLRAVWDPRISPALKKTYGYDAEGHVVAINPPGKETWALIYGTTAGDTSPGRLVQVVRPEAATSLWSGSSPANTAAPTLSGPTVANVQMATSNGTWSNAPVAYGYQWEQCDSAGAECKAIAGATDDTYTPASADVGHTIVAQVRAINGGGATVATTTASAVVTATRPEAPSVKQSVASSSLTAVSCVLGTTTCVASDAKGEAHYATNVSASSSATWKSWSGPNAGPSEALSCPALSLCLIADGEKGGGGTLYYGALGGSWTQAYNPSNGIDAISCSSSSLCVAGQDKYGDFGYATNPNSSLWTAEELGSAGRAITGVSCLWSLFCAAVDGNGDVHIATSAAQVKSSTWTESNIDGSTALNGIACISAASCVAVDGVGDFLDLAISESGSVTVTKQHIDGTNSVKSISCTAPRCVAVDDHGNVFVSGDSGGTWLEAYQLGDSLTSVSCSSYLLCVASDTTGHIVSFDPNEAFTQGEGGAQIPGTTIEYGVPASGSGAPYALGSSEAAKWAQTDVPVEATALFPAWKRMSWPAPGKTWSSSSYEGATVDYFDAADRVVNTAEPTGGILTNEYNSYGDMVRALSADDRQAALKEGSKSAEVSQTLDTQNSYGSEGTELLSTLGPLHTVKLASGATVKARRHTVYSYDEGAPAGGPYKLETKVSEGAQIAGEPEADVRTTTSSYAGQNGLGWTLGKPTATRVDPSGLDLVHSATYDESTGDLTETRTPGAPAPGEEVLSGYYFRSGFGSEGSGSGQMKSPKAIVRDAEGNLYVADTGNNRIDEFSSSGTFIRHFGGPGESEGWLSSPQGIAIDKEGYIWVANTGHNDVDLFTQEGKYLLSTGFALDRPTSIAYSAHDNQMYVADWGHGRIESLNAARPTEWELIGSLSSEGYGQFSEPEGIAVDPSGNIWVSEAMYGVVEEVSPSGTIIKRVDEEELRDPKGLALDSEGNVFVTEGGWGSHSVVALTSSGTHKYEFGGSGSSEEQMTTPYGIVFDGSGDAFVVDSGADRVQEWIPAASEHKSSGTGGTHGTQTIYYTAGANSEASACGNEPAWAGLPCEKRPAAQPETSGLPNLPVTTVTYNIWDEPLVSTETVGSTTRTDTNVYDEAGRQTKETPSSSVGAALPGVEYSYSSETGALILTSTTTEGVTQSIESEYDRLGELTSYTDANDNTTNYYYNEGRLYAVMDALGEESLKVYGYSGAGLLSEVYDWTAGPFTAAYDPEGNLTAETYPNGMTANRAFDPTGREVAIEYVKTTHCTSGCVWYSQSEYPSIHGQTLSQTGTLSSQTYAYDAAGRLTTVKDTPSGEGCTTRIYGYEEETNITSLTTRAPGAEGKCASEGGTAVNHTYDSANRLMDAGIEYNAFGGIAKLPATDAGGSTLTSTYYVDGTLASQSQNGETIGYKIDADGRDSEAVSTGTTNSTITYAYDDEGDEPAWTEDTTGEVTRNIYGFEGTLTAVQKGMEEPALQIEDLHRNVVGTASLSETATGLLSKGDSTEYGVPRTSSPPKYSWQGAAALRTELPSGVIAMGARSYVPEIARFLQPDPIEGGSANAYAYTYGDPIESADPSGEYTVATPSWLEGFLDEEAEVATEAAIQRAAEERAAREEAEEKAREMAEVESEPLTEIYGGGKGKKGKKDKAGKVNSGIAMAQSKSKACKGPGPYKCAHPGAGTKLVKEGKKGKKDSGKAVREEVGGIIEKAGEEWEQSEREKIATEEWEECWYHEIC